MPDASPAVRRNVLKSIGALIAMTTNPIDAIAKTLPAAKRRGINPTATGWSQAMEVSQPSRVLFVSGQVPEDEQGVPERADEQCRLAFANVAKQLEAGGMTTADIVKLNIYLSSRDLIQPAYEARGAFLAGRATPAMTILICEIYDSKWLLEIEAIAMA